MSSAAQARRIAQAHLRSERLADGDYTLALAEFDGRRYAWHVPVNAPRMLHVGEIVVDARRGAVDRERSSTLPPQGEPAGRSPVGATGPGVSLRAPLGDTIIAGDSEHVLAVIPDGTVDLVVTSPPYFNSRRECAEYADYGAYLDKLRGVFAECHRILDEGRFLVVNSSPVLVRRAGRNASSRRLAVPFDLHSIITAMPFDFIDDIVWSKPSGAGWASSRGRRFAKDRNPLAYKTVPVTEYVIVYRKATPRLIDWNIARVGEAAVGASKVADGYERTNIWHMAPRSDPDHPAPFPRQLSDNVVAYYSYAGDVVCDPFAGTGTVAESCIEAGRRFVVAEQSPRYVDVIKQNVHRWMGNAAASVACINTPPISAD